MSGGHFDYKNYALHDIADQIQNVIDNNDSEEKDEWGQRKGRAYRPEVIEQFCAAVLLLRSAAIWVHRVDYLLSDDDGEDSFLQRLAEDLEKLK